MPSLCKLNFSNFFRYFAFSPKSDKLSPADQKLALIGTILFGSITLGIGHLVCRLFFYDRKTVKDPDTPESKKVQKVAQKLQEHLDLPQNIAGQIANYLKKHPPRNAIEYLVSYCTKESYRKVMGLHDRDLLMAYRERANPKGPGSKSMTNALLSYYFGKMKKGSCVLSSGEYLGEIPEGAIAYTYEVTEAKTPLMAHQLVESFLRLELEKNQTMRPKKIFIPMSWNKEGIGHSALLVVEPSPEELREARITVINSHGDSLKMYREYELEVMRAAREIYSSPKTSVIRNTKRFYTTAYSCSHDMIEVAKNLAKVPDAQAAVKKGLPVQTAAHDKRVRLEHGEDLLKFFLHYY